MAVNYATVVVLRVMFTLKGAQGQSFITHSLVAFAFFLYYYLLIFEEFIFMFVKDLYSMNILAESKETERQKI